MIEKCTVMRPADTQTEALERLSDITRILRQPDGCPWDREQTHESLIRGMIEEAYEVIEAIERKDPDNLCEELGDMLLQVVMHSQIAEDCGEFTLKDVAEGVSEKMIRRHPHVFGENIENASFSTENSVDNVLLLWENIKNKEKANASAASDMDKIPRSLPALLRSEKVQKKAAKKGFDWSSIDGAFEKLDEETEELKKAYAAEDKENIKEELGDLLFAAVNVARFLGVDPEDALTAATQKFMKRFAYVETKASESGRDLEKLRFEEMDELWNEAKRSL